MAALSFRDRLFSRRAARAITSPVGVVGGAAVGAGAVIAGGLPVWAGIVVGAGLWGVNALRLLPRGPRRERIDPFALHDPWRRFVQDALQARSRFAEAVHRAPHGPLRDRLGEIAARMQTGVDECWLVAKQGQALVRARRGIDLADVDRQLARLRPEGGTGAGGETGDGAGGAAPGEAPGPPSTAVVRSLEAQRATAERLDAVIARAESELRLLDARLDEAVARTLELTAHAATSAGSLSGLGTDVDHLVSEMESLRQALDETSVAAAGGAAGGAGRDLPPGGGR
ncbi:MAG TPA: hypothetical protein VFZ79_11865 [Acidimicrobiales bacterium]